MKKIATEARFAMIREELRGTQEDEEELHASYSGRKCENKEIRSRGGRRKVSLKRAKGGRRKR